MDGYQTKIKHTAGGDAIIVASGGKVTIEAGGELDASMATVSLPNVTAKSVDVTIPSAQVLTLNATPRAIVAAPGANLALIFEGAIIHKPAGTAYAGIAAGEDLSIKYTDASGLEVAQCETTGFLDQATAQTRWVQGQRAASGPSQITPVANAPLVLHLLVGEITTGDSDLRLRVFYRVVPTVLT